MIKKSKPTKFTRVAQVEANVIPERAIAEELKAVAKTLTKQIPLEIDNKNGFELRISIEVYENP